MAHFYVRRRRMGIWANIIERVRNRLFGTVIRSQAHLPDSIINDEMAAAIDDWVNLYYNRAPWLAQNRLTLGLPSAIAREIATLVTLEMQIRITNEKGEAVQTDENTRAAFIDKALQTVRREVHTRTEYACAFGGLVFKPYVNGDEIGIDFINADNFYPTKYDANGDIKGAVFIERMRKGKDSFVRVEHHELEGKKYTIRNRAFRSYSNESLGNEIPISSIPEWANIQEETTVDTRGKTLFAYFKIPHGNVIDADSVLGVSVYARALSDGILEEADKQFQRLSWEYEGGELSVDASEEAFRPTKQRDGTFEPRLPAGKERLFRLNALSDGQPLLQTFAPSLRDTSYMQGLNHVLERFEDVSGIARGTFSQVQGIERTATEIINSKQRTYATVSSIQMSLQRALERLVEAVDTLATLYRLAPEGKYNVSFTWDDSIVVDATQERAQDTQDVRDGLMMPFEYRMKWYGESEEQARKILSENSAPSDDGIMGFMAAQQSAVQMGKSDEQDEGAGEVNAPTK